MAVIEYARNWYGKYEKPISSGSLFFGFIFDILTISRLDTAWANIYIVTHIFFIGFFIILIHVKEKKELDELNPSKAHFWYVNILQFFFGGILSTYLISYFRSADIFVTWPFIVILATAFISNESLKRHYIRLSFQIGLYYLAVYSFLIFFFPVLFHRINSFIFILSGITSLIFIYFFIKILFYFVKDKFNHRKGSLIILISGIFILINVLYFTHLIPPIPLSIKDAGIYHSVVRNSNNSYTVMYEDRGIFGFLQLYKKFKQVSGEPVYAYSAIFSPSHLNLVLIHEWQHYDPVRMEWTIENTVDLPVIGGRGGGFRTYSVRENLQEGKWRVDVKTNDGLLVGRLRFNVINVESLPQLKTEVK